MMRSVNYPIKWTVCTILGAVVLWALGAHAATLPPDPDNAALLYYQAFLLCHQPDDATEAQVSRVLWGAEPDDRIRQYVRLCGETIEIAEAAGQTPKCDWGMRYSQGVRVPSPPPLQHARALTSLLEVSAAVLATDGDYRAALARCLTIRKFARRIGNDTVVLYAASVSFDGSSLRAIRHVLGRMPPDADTLAWLENQLATVQGSAESPARPMQMSLELDLQTMRADPNIVAAVRDELVESAKGNSAKDAIRSLTDEQVVARARDPYAEFLGSALRVMDSNMPYEKKYAEIERLTKELKEKFGKDPAARQMITGRVEDALKFYSLQVRHRAFSNALRAAIKIYLAVAKAGRLPQSLPEGLPKDPYSGQDFEYETTKDGFVLRCRVKAIDDNKVWQYEFKVRKSGSAEEQPSK